MKSVLTTGEVAKRCHVAMRTVSKWIDSGRLKGYRLPGSQDRRIPRQNLVDFLRANKMPLGDLVPDVLIVSQDALLIDAIREHCDGGFNVHVAGDSFEAGKHFSTARVVVIDHALGPVARDIDNRFEADAATISVTPFGEPKHFGDSAFSKPVDARALVNHIFDRLGF